MPKDRYIIQRGIETELTLPHSITEEQSRLPDVNVEPGTEVDYRAKVIAWVDVAIVTKDDYDTATFFRADDALNNWLDDNFAADSPRRQGHWRTVDPRFMDEFTIVPVTEVEVKRTTASDDTWTPKLPEFDFDIPF